MLSTHAVIRFAASPARPNTPSAANPLPPVAGDTVKFSGAEMEGLLQDLQALNPAKYYQHNRPEIDQLMQREVLPGISGARIFKAFLEDQEENPISETGRFLDRLQAKGEIREIISRFLKDAFNLKLLRYDYRSGFSSYTPTPLGQHVLTVLKNDKPGSRLL